MKIEYFFDFSCPYAYLATTQIEALAKAHQAELVWKPMLLGGVFRASGTKMNLAASQSAAKNKHGADDMMRWAQHYDVPLRMPSAHPIRTVRALRALLASPEAHWPALIHKFYQAYWVDGLDISEAETVESILREVGLEEETIILALSANDSETCKQELRTRTDEAIARGVFGAPTMFISGAHLSSPLMLWGQDRFAQAEAILQGWSPNSDTAPPETPRPKAGARNAEIDFWYDFSSPFAYLGAMRIAELAKRNGATLRWRPLLLGALFKSIGTPNVPLFEMSPAKRAYQGKDIERWASYTQQPFRFASPFPIRSVTALRLALLAKDRIGELTILLFRAAWAEGRDISDPATLLELLKGAGFPGETMLDECRTQAVKDELRQNTTEAEGLGVFGVPTSIITIDGESQLYWGQDRFALAEQGLR